MKTANAKKTIPLMQKIQASAAVLFFLFITQNGTAQVNDSTNCQQQVELLKKELRESKEEYRKLLEATTVVVVRKRETENPDNKPHTIIGMNMTTMLSRLVPFGNGVPLAGPTSLMFRKLQGNKAFRLGIGLNARNEADVFNASLRIGVERQKELNKHFVFTRGFDGILATGSFNIPGFRFNDNTSNFLGALLSLGLEYRLDKRITLGTETLLVAGFQNTSGSIFATQIVPPLALYLHATIN